jgi:hypothetical protein
LTTWSDPPEADEENQSMKLPRLRRKADPETAEPASASRAVPVLGVLIYSNTGLSEQEFSAQTDKIGRVASYDRDTRSWYTWIPLDRPDGPRKC